MNQEIILTTKIGKSGSSLVIIIPKPIVNAFDLKKGDVVEVKIKKRNGG